MTTTSYPLNHPLAVKLWAKKLFQESIKQTWMAKFMGEGSDSLIQIKDDLHKSPGDQIIIGLRTALKGEGTRGDETLSGNEEELSTHSLSVIVDQLRHAVRSAGKMSEQRVPFSIREEARLGLQDWWAERFDTCFFNQICGNTTIKDTRFTGNQGVEAATNILRANGKTKDQDLVKEDVFSLKLIDKAVERAKTVDPIIRPLRINGENKFVMFLHPYQVTDLRTSTNMGEWLDIQKAALAGGEISKNPIYTGALGEYNGVILHESSRITQGIKEDGTAMPNTRRAVMCGAQAVVAAFAKGASLEKMSWCEESFDYDNQLGVSAGLIFGIKKTRFKDQDFATIILSTFAAQH